MPPCQAFGYLFGPLVSLFTCLWAFVKPFTIDMGFGYFACGFYFILRAKFYKVIITCLN
jgi:hypothetical protein